MTDVLARRPRTARPRGLDALDAARMSTADVLARVGGNADGLTSAQAAERLKVNGPNVVAQRRVNALALLGHQLRSPLLLLLAFAAAMSVFVGDPNQAAIIGVILVTSIALTFGNEYRAERTAVALHDRLRHHVTTLRDGEYVRVDVTRLTVGDVVALDVGQVVPADLRLLTASGLECDESVLTGEALPVEKAVGAVAATDLQGCSNVAFMGTVVADGEATGVVYAVGADAEFGSIAAGLGTRAPDTAFQIGLRRFSYLLLGVALTLMVGIVAINLALRRPLLETALFALAIAVGITPQLLPAVVSTSLAAGARRLTAMKVLVKRLVCIEDLGDVDVLVTDKTGTLTDGHITFLDAVDATGARSPDVLRAGLLATEIEAERGERGSNALDAALSEAVDARAVLADAHRVAVVPFDHQRRATSVLVDDGGRRWLVVKGAPERVLALCDDPPATATAVLDELFEAGRRVVAVARKPADGMTGATAADEVHLRLCGFLCFSDEPKPAAREALSRLAGLGVEVKVATGDNPRVATRVCDELGLPVTGVLTGDELTRMGTARMAEAFERYTVFARVSPQQKADLITAARSRGRAVAFLGDGVNDALGLHAADVGISVDTASDVAKDAADVILLEKDLGVLAAGVAEGRRIFANTIKYVLMGTSSNFGNMFSAAAASAMLSFLPMLPSQILLNNLLYDGSQLAIPSDRVDEDQLRAPSHWDVEFIRHFMVRFGLLSSLFDFLTFGLLLAVLHAGPAEFRTGWFIESLATQTLIVFAIRTRRVPFFASRASTALTVCALAAVVIGVAITVSPWSSVLGFSRLPWQFFLVLAGLVVIYLLLAEVTKAAFFRDIARRTRPASGPVRTHRHRIHRRAGGFTTTSRAGPGQARGIGLGNRRVTSRRASTPTP